LQSDSSEKLLEPWTKKEENQKIQLLHGGLGGSCHQRQRSFSFCEACWKIWWHLLFGRKRKIPHSLAQNEFHQRKRKKKKWHALGCTDSYDPDVNDEETFDNMEINSDLHGLIYTYYHETNDKSVEMVVAPGTVDETGKWIWKDDEVPTRKKKAKASATRAGASSSRAVASTSRAPSSSRAAASSTASARTTRSSPGKRGSLFSSSKPSGKKSRH
jgi:hypothetical protein